MANLMDILILVQGSGLYVYNENYKRIGQRVKDNNDLFIRNNEEVITSINNLTVSDDKLNVSLCSKLNGVVKINGGKAVDLPEEFECQKFRTQTIIKNGKMNAETLTLLVPEVLLHILKDVGTPLEVIGGLTEYKGKNYYRIVIDLEGMQTIGTEVVTTKEILKLAIRKDKLVARGKILKYFNDKQTTDRVVYTPEQLEVLKQHGIDRSGNYVGVDLEVVKDETRFYIAKNIQFQVKGQSSIPSVNELLKRVNAGSKLNSIQQYMKEQYDEIKMLDQEQIEKEIDINDETLNRIKLKLAIIRMYKVLKDVEEFEGADIDAKGNLTYTDETGTLVIKSSQDKVFY